MSWLADQAAAAGAAAAELHRIGAELRDVLDQAHAAGLWIPPYAVAAVQTVVSLGVAWGHNAQGKPAPAEHRDRLGLGPVRPPAVAAQPPGTTARP